MMYLRIAFLIIIILSCLSVYYLFGKGTTKKEGFLVEKVVDFNDQGQPKNTLIDEYGNPLIDGYYFSPVIASGKWTTGVKDYKQYMLKSVPYGFAASTDKKSVVPKTNVANVSMGIKPASITDSFPEWRELTFDEYSQVMSSPIPKYEYGPDKTGVEVPPPPGKFKINKKQAMDMVDKYEFATLPVNHKLLGPESLNPNKTYLSYSGPFSDIPGYSYKAPDFTGEFAIVNGALTTQIQDPGTGNYKIRLTTEYNPDNTPKTVRFVVATIPLGYALDPADTSFTKLVSNVSKYDANVLPTDAPTAPTTTDAPEVTETPAEGGVYYQYDQTGKLVEVNYKESNFAPVLYYMPGAYKFGSSAFVPTYEDSVYLSRTTRDAQLLPGAEANAGLGGAPINSDAQLGGFCNANENNKTQMEEKCNAMPLDSCASTSCCVLLGGQKCVAGSEKGPYMTSNYTDYTIMPKNKDFYYYQGKCYGNCTGRTMSMISSVMPSTMPSASVSTTTP
jgi:hypothetical protein